MFNFFSKIKLAPLKVEKLQREEALIRVESKNPKSDWIFEIFGKKNPVPCLVFREVEQTHLQEPQFDFRDQIGDGLDNFRIMRPKKTYSDNLFNFSAKSN